MNAKKYFAMAIVAATVSTGTVFAQEHTHDWMDNIALSTESTNVYTCACGETKYEEVAAIRDYIVTLEANGGQLDTSELMTEHDKVKLPIPARSSDYQFDGWFTDDGQEVTSDWKYVADTTLYAHWSVVGRYTLNFNSDGGSYIPPVTGTYGTSVVLDSYIPTKPGYIFEGWFADPRTKQTQVTKFVFQEDDVVYAKWRDDGTAKAVVLEQPRNNKVNAKKKASIMALWFKQLMKLHKSIYSE